MITEQYVSFETAKMLKEAGFDVPCRGVYVTDRTGYYEFREYDNKQTKDDLCWNTEDGFQYEYLAPTQALAARWLREVHGIHVSSEIMVYPMYECVGGKEVGERISWGYYIIPVERGEPIHGNDEEYKTYEEALEAGLKRGLKLIKK